jgi:nicotinate-nucleotide adenylyltransferase
MGRADARKVPPAFPSMRIGLLGGSFNPAHDGHRHISLAAIARLGLDRVWWLVTPGNPLKSRSELAGLTERIAIARQVAAHPRIDITGFEAELHSPYAIDTIGFLQQRYPGVRFIWIIGGDNLCHIHLWRRWRDIFQAVPILVADRPEFRHRAFASPAATQFRPSLLRDVAGLPRAISPAWAYLTLPLNKSSSSAIRLSTKANNALSKV